MDADRIKGWIARLLWTSKEYDDGYEFALFHERDENDREYAERLQREAESQRWRDEHDRREFERLKKKFGGSKSG